MGIRQDMIDYRVAIKRRYPITDEMKSRMLESVMAIISDPVASPREKTGAAKVLIAAEQQNQADEKAFYDNERILEIAERIGIRADVEGFAEGQADSVIGLIDADQAEREKV